MINTSTSITNGGRTFQVVFDCSPKDVTGPSIHGPRTHKAGIHTTRNGIEEGVTVKDIWYHGDDGVWKKWEPLDPNNKQVLLTTSKNDAELRVEATFEIWTMGFPGMTYPFFYFGNFGNNPNRYQDGYFSDGAPSIPSGLKSKFASVPEDWQLRYTGWVKEGGNRHLHSWCYQNTQKGQNQWNSNGYEQNVGQTRAQGWTSYRNDGTASPYTQFTRHHCYWIFTKTYKGYVKSSGVQVNPSIPQLEVIPSKGDKGSIKITNNNDRPQFVKIDCINRKNNQIANIMLYPHDNGIAARQTKTMEIDFFEKFGEAGRGADLYYYAWFKDYDGNLSNNEQAASKIPANQWVGIHRFNGRPSVPGGLFVSGRDNIYYDNINIKWNPSTDPDNDTVSYKVNFEVIRDGATIKNELIATTKDTNINYSIAPFEEGVTCKVKVCATDGFLDSEYSQVFTFIKGTAARTASNIYPLNYSTIYNNQPRIIIDLGGQTSVNVKIKHNGLLYASNLHPECFSIYGGKCVFRLPEKMSPGQNQVVIQISNVYGDSSPVTMNYTLATNPYNISTLDPDIIITSDQVKNIRRMLNDIRKAYGYSDMPYSNNLSSIIYAQDYIETYSAAHEVNDFINSYVATDNFDYSLASHSVAKNTIIDDSQWDELVKAIDNI